MVYAIIHGGGLAGPPRSSGGGYGMFTQWGPDGVFGRGRGKQQLGGLGAVSITPAFAQQIAEAHGALTQLAAVSKTVELATTDVQIKGMAQQALRFAQERGPNVLNQALTNADPLPIARVQGASKKILDAMKPEVIPALLSRWVLLPLLGPAGLVVPAGVVESAREEGRDIVDAFLPEAKKGLNMALIAAGIGGLFAVGYFIRSIK